MQAGGDPGAGLHLATPSHHGLPAATRPGAEACRCYAGAPFTVLLPTMTFLAIDIGNTRLKWALYAAPHTGAVLLEQGAVFLETIDELADHDWQKLTPPASMLGCVVAGDAVRRRVEEQM